MPSPLELPLELLDLISQEMDAPSRAAWRRTCLAAYNGASHSRPRTNVKIDTGERARDLLQSIEAFACYLPLHLRQHGYARLHTVQIEYDYTAWPSEEWDLLCKALSVSGLEALNVRRFQRQIESWCRIYRITDATSSCKTLRLKESVGGSSFFLVPGKI